MNCPRARWKGRRLGWASLIAVIPSACLGGQKERAPGSPSCPGDSDKVWWGNDPPPCSSFPSWNIKPGPLKSPGQGQGGGHLWGASLLHPTGSPWGCSKSWGPSTDQPWAVGTPSVLWAWFPLGHLPSTFLAQWLHVQAMRGSRPSTFGDEGLGLGPDQGHTALPHPCRLSRCRSPCPILLGAEPWQHILMQPVASLGL